MQLIYQGVDITSDVDILTATHRDVSGGRSDCLELALDHAAIWRKWGPKQDDTIELVHDGYSTGKLYLNTILPEADSYRILATASTSKARRRVWRSYENNTLEEIFRQCAAESGMDFRLYGLDKQLKYPYILRKNESCAALLDRLARMEGAVMKTVSGRYTGISITAAQDAEAGATMELPAKQEGITYMRRENTKYSSLTVKTPYARVTANDTGAESGNDVTICGLPAADQVTAGRWARGLLLEANRRAEVVTLETELNTGLTAMVRIDIQSAADENGEWIVDEAEHDFVNKRSRTRLLRCIRTVV